MSEYESNKSLMLIRFLPFFRKWTGIHFTEMKSCWIIIYFWLWDRHTSLYPINNKPSLFWCPKFHSRVKEITKCVITLVKWEVLKCQSQFEWRIIFADKIIHCNRKWKNLQIQYDYTQNTWHKTTFRGGLGHMWPHIVCYVIWKQMCPSRGSYFCGRTHFKAL